MPQGVTWTLIGAVLVLAGAAAADAQAEQLPLWEAGLGATVISFPHYRGSDERRSWVLPFPYVVYRGEFLKADERRVRGLFFKTERAKILTFQLIEKALLPIDLHHDLRRKLATLRCATRAETIEQRSGAATATHFSTRGPPSRPGLQARPCSSRILDGNRSTVTRFSGSNSVAGT